MISKHNQSNMNSYLVQIHSIVRYFALILLIFVMVKSYLGLKKGTVLTTHDKKLALFLMIAFHLQLILGLGLYFMSPKVIFGPNTMDNGLLRFFTLEHPLLMIISISSITIGYVKAKRRNDKSSYKALLIYGIVVLVLLIIAIPWPFRNELGTAWF